MMSCFKMLHAKTDKTDNRKKNRRERKKANMPQRERKAIEKQNKIKKAAKEKQLGQEEILKIAKALGKIPKVSTDVNELRQSKEYRELEAKRRLYLRSLIKQAEIRFKKWETNRKAKWITPSERKNLLKKFDAEFVDKLEDIALNPSLMEQLEKQLRTLGVPKPTILEGTEYGYELNDAIAYIACTSSLRYRDMETNIFDI